MLFSIVMGVERTKDSAAPWSVMTVSHAHFSNVGSVIRRKQGLFNGTGGVPFFSARCACGDSQERRDLLRQQLEQAQETVRNLEEIQRSLDEIQRLRARAFRRPFSSLPVCMVVAAA